MTFHERADQGSKQSRLGTHVTIVVAVTDEFRRSYGLRLMVAEMYLSLSRPR